jgi:Spy/CpxP family protein refolding chaperone
VWAWEEGGQAGRDGTGTGAKLGLTVEQTEKFEKMAEKHMAAMKAEKERFEAEVKTILTPEQQAKFEELKANREKKMKGPEAGVKRGGRMGQVLKQLDLPEEKLAKVQAIMKESWEKMAAAPKGDRAARQQIQKEKTEKIKAVLTPEEMARFEQAMQENRPGRPHPGKGMGFGRR